MSQAIVFLLQPLRFWLLVFPRGEVAFRRFLLLFPFLPSYMGLRVSGSARRKRVQGDSWDHAMQRVAHAVRALGSTTTEVPVLEGVQ